MPSTGGFPSRLSDLVSSLVISSGGERNTERKTTDPFSSLCLPLEGPERLCLSGENREEQVPLLDGEEPRWTAAARWIWAFSLGKAVLCSASTEAGPKSKIFACSIT